MSVIGISPSDIVALGKGVKSLYDSYKRAPSDFADLTTQLGDFHLLLKSLVNALAAPEAEESKEIPEEYRQECLSVMEGCTRTADELLRIKSKHSWKDDDGRRHWKRLRAGTKSAEIEPLQRRLWNHMLFLQGTHSRIQQKQNGLKLLTLGRKQDENKALIKRQEDALVELKNEQRELRQQLALSTQAKVDVANDVRGLGEALMAVIGTYHDITPERKWPVPQTEDAVEHQMYVRWDKLRLELRKMGFDFTLLELYEEEIFVFFEGLYRKSLRSDRQQSSFADSGYPPSNAPGGHRQASSPYQPTYPLVDKADMELDTLKYYDIKWREHDKNPNQLVLLQELSVEDTDILFEHTARLRRKRAEESSKTKLHVESDSSSSSLSSGAPPRAPSPMPAQEYVQPSRRLSLVRHATKHPPGLSRSETLPVRPSNRPSLSRGSKEPPPQSWKFRGEPS